MQSSTTSATPLFESDKASALQAISEAQRIAFAPYIFQASVLLRDKGILKIVDDAKQEGIEMEAVMAKVKLSRYAVRVLMEAGLGIGLLIRKEGKYRLTKTGHFFINHPMGVINTDFMRDVCYDGAKDLEASLEKGKPVGLRHLGDWETIYEGLSILPEPANHSWFAFDHYYSDKAFPDALPHVMHHSPLRIMDIGANTGKFSMAALVDNPHVEMGLVDLPVQLNVARKNLADAGFNHRVQFHECNVLDPNSELPTGYDTIWMSQFLDCFADEEIVEILKKCHRALPPDGRVFINELFWDAQRFPSSAFSLQMTSLYFTTMANGNSQMYDSAVFVKLIERANFAVVKQTDDIGNAHTLLELQKK